MVFKKQFSFWETTKFEMNGARAPETISSFLFFYLLENGMVIGGNGVWHFQMEMNMYES